MKKPLNADSDSKETGLILKLACCVGPFGILNAQHSLRPYCLELMGSNYSFVKLGWVFTALVSEFRGCVMIV